jgi:hypothetical protein
MEAKLNALETIVRKRTEIGTRDYAGILKEITHKSPNRVSWRAIALLIGSVSR